MSKTKTSKTYKDRAQTATNKAAVFGEDIDLSKYVNPEDKHTFQSDPSNLSVDVKDKMLGAGIILDNPRLRSGTYLQMDGKPVHFSARQEGVEVMALSRALDKHDWLGDYFWKAVDVMLISTPPT